MSEPAYLSDPLQAAATGMIVAFHAHQAPDRMAIRAEQGPTRTYGELNARINQVARVMREQGLKPGDAVALVCSNRAEFAEALLACFRTGLRVSPVNWHLTAPEIAYIVNDCEAKVLFGDARFRDTMEEVLKESPHVQLPLAIGGSIPGFKDYDAEVEKQSGENIDNPSRGFQMLYTSGTTGYPKGVYREVATAPTMLTEFAHYEPGKDTALCTGPLYHAAPLGLDLLAAIGNGVGIVLMDKWDPEKCLKFIEEYKITQSHMVPTMFHRMLALPEDVRSKYDVSSLKFIIHGAAPCPVHTKQQMYDWFGDVIYEYYGATEGVGTIVGPDDWKKKPGTVGVAPEGMLIVDEETDEELGPGKVGIIWIPVPEEGGFKYYKAEEKTQKAYRKGTHYSMHDMGYIDEDGWLYLSDRRADLILSGGVNIYPAEVDAALLKHDAVEDVCTIGVPNPDWGQEVMSVVQLKEGVAASDQMAQDLIAHCQATIAKFKCPRKIEFTDELPRSDAGKIQRRKVRDKYVPES
ncbi:MAG: AMP-binding protein [Pseudomonadota bacterium]|nr:AMP-binding protein [Pseudomonadota bacterium]